MSTTRSFAAINQNEEIRSHSSSGGVFYAIAEKVLSEGGVVFGAAFDENWLVHHEACERMEDLPKLMQSKYVQSSMENTFREAQSALEQGRKVLFCATPCQVQALLSVLRLLQKGEDWQSNLITMDFICHGVPSRRVWREYLKEVSAGRTIANVNFRDKSKGWRSYCLSIAFTDGTSVLEMHKRNPYMKGFLQNLYLRDSCCSCKFRGVERTSDFTIADFWGVHELMPAFFDDKGTSIVMTHNERARKLLEGLRDTLSLREIDNAIVEKYNSPVIKSGERNPKRDSFMAQSASRSVTKTIEQYTKIPMMKRVFRKVRAILSSVSWG